MSNRRFWSRAAAWIGICSVGATGLLPGCRGDPLARIDRETRRLVEQRSELVGGGAGIPRIRRIDAAGVRDPDQARRQPPTTNPAAAELRYEPALPDRDVAERLQAYAREGILTPEDEGVLAIDLAGALRISQSEGPEFKSSEEEYIFAAIRLLIERHRWSPRLFNDTTFNISGTGDEGRFETAARVLNELRLSQRLPRGGQVEARWVWLATEQLREQASGRYRQSSEIVLSGTVPLLRGAGVVAQEELIQAERNLVYQARSFENFRREFLVSIARDYFDLLQSMAQIANQERQLEGLRFIESAVSARVEAGRLAEFERNNAANQVLRATAALAALREQFVLQLDRFKVRIGLPVERPAAILPLEMMIPQPQITPERATELALAYRLDLQNQRDQLDDTRRAVANARNQLLPSLDLTGRVGVPTDPGAREGGVALDPDFANYSASVTFGLPLDREIERLALRQSTIAHNRREREYAAFRDRVVLSVRQATRSIDLARFQFDLAERQVDLNRRRLEELRLKADEIDTQKQLDAENEYLDSLNARDRALNSLRNAILNFLLESGQLRVGHDGSFLRLPGMDDPLAEPPVEPMEVPPEFVAPERIPGVPQEPGPSDEPRAG